MNKQTFLDVIQVSSLILTGVGLLLATIDTFNPRTNRKIENGLVVSLNISRAIWYKYNRLGATILFLLFIYVLLGLTGIVETNWLYLTIFSGLMSFTFISNTYHYLILFWLKDRPLIALSLTLNALGFFGELIQVYFISVNS